MDDFSKINSMDDFYKEIGKNLPTIEIHAIENFGPSLLNRGEDGRAKTIVFGGTQRVRVSSQCIKYAMRTDEKTRDTWRTRCAGDLVATKLHERFPEATDEYLGKIAIAVNNCITPKGDKNADKAKEKKDHMVTICMNDVNAFIDLIIAVFPINCEIADNDLVVDVDKNAIKSKTKTTEILKGMMATAASRPVSTEMAIYGTMSTSLAMRSIDSSVSLNHMLSTNEASLDVDFFTAVDEWATLKKLGTSEAVGAGMMQETDIKSACFYRYGAINTLSVAENLLVGIDFSDKEELRKRLEMMKDAVSDFIAGFILAVPKAKQASMASHPVPSAVYITAGVRPQPYSRENAFLRCAYAHDNEDVVSDSVKKLVDYIDNDPFNMNAYDKELWIARDEYDSPKTCVRRTLAETLNELEEYIDEKLY